MSGIYIHVPFCKQACSYCDFYFVTRPQQKGNYVEALIQEIQSKKGSVFTQEAVNTIYFGGGTPSLLEASEVSRIMDALASTFKLRTEEVTFELNPDDVTAEYLADLKKVGVNRVSMGVQSFDANLLQFMNRTHTAEEALRCMHLLKDSGIDVYSVDLIYGNPGQTVEMLEADLEQLKQFDPPHISAYSLTIEPNTRLGKQVELGRLLPQEDEQVEKHFELVEKALSEMGIHRYEVSNFGKKGSEARHNSNYWEHENYLGLGPGAHSFWWNTDRKSAKRWSNEADLKKYLEEDFNIGPVDGEEMNLKELGEERIMLGLRTIKGVQLEELKEHYDYSLSEAQSQYLERMQKEGKAVLGKNIRLTSKGLRIADAITLDLLTVK